MGSLLDVTANKKAEGTLRARGADLQIKTKSLEEVNTALKVLLKRREEDKTEIEEKTFLGVISIALRCLTTGKAFILTCVM